MASTDIQKLAQAEPVPEHSVDRLAELKAQIAALDREYERLREMVVTGQASTAGPLWQAVVSSVTRRTIAIADAQRLLPFDLFEALVKPEPPKKVFAAVTWRYRGFRSHAARSISGAL